MTPTINLRGEAYVAAQARHQALQQHALAQRELAEATEDPQKRGEHLQEARAAEARAIAIREGRA